MTTAVQVQIRRDTAANLSVATPAAGELGGDTTRNRLVLGDGLTNGGNPHAKLTDAQGYGFVANFGLAAAVASNNLTISLVTANGSNPSAANSIYVPFRNGTLVTGTPSFVEITSSLSITVADGDTIGTANSVPFRLWVVLFNSGGTPVLGVINCATGGGAATLDESLLQSPSSAIGNNAGVFYSATAVAGNSPFRILGYVEYGSGLTGAGVYNTGPTKVQPFGPGIRQPGDRVQLIASTATSAAISPKSAVNLVRVFASASWNPQVTGNVAYAVKRGSTSIATLASYSPVTTGDYAITFAGIVDAPATTSSTTYSFSGASGVSSTSYLQLEEIAV